MSISAPVSDVSANQPSFTPELIAPLDRECELEKTDLPRTSDGNNGVINKRRYFFQ